MTLDWQTFKFALGPNTSVTYIDEEDSEIPIDSECEFQEALRLARLHKERLRIIVYDNKLQPNQKTQLSVVLPVANPTDKPVFIKAPAMSRNSSVKETCHCTGDGPPEWFTRYMKKFKKELLYELKSYVHDSIHSTIEKEKKLCEVKSDVYDLATEKNDSLFPVSTQIKKKKKLEKDFTDMVDQREVKLQRKLEKLHSAKSERLEKLDNKMRVLFEEKRRLSERKRHSRPKLDKTSVGAPERRSLKKSVYFRQNNVFLILSPGSEFLLTVDLVNDGKLPWSDPRFECFDFAGLHPKEKCISLPRLNPKESYSAILRGKASKNAGIHHLKWRVIDGLEPFGPQFTCLARVEALDPVETPCKESEGTARREMRDFVGALIDFEKDIIANSQKKIEENITEIQRRLHDIDLLRPSTGSEIGGKRGNGKGGKCKTGCDLSQDSEVKEKSWKERLEEEEVLFGVDCLSLDPPVDEVCSLPAADKKENEKTDNFEKVKNVAQSELSSDSELSLIFMSEEDEEEKFVVVPSISPSPAESVNEVKSLSGENVPNELVKKADDKKEVQAGEAAPADTCHPSPTRSLSPVGEEIFKSKKIKSKSTEYHFTAENLTHPTFVQHQEGIFTGRPSTFKFTAGDEENCGKDKAEKREDQKRKEIVQKTDALGRDIYAVNSMGYCLRMRDLTEQWERTNASGKTSQRRLQSPGQERRSERFNEIPSVNILPNALMDGATNVASMAFNTAKAVLNNLQSTFVPEGKSEMGRPRYSA